MEKTQVPDYSPVFKDITFKERAISSSLLTGHFTATYQDII
ncbi:hypothetical protein [Bacillus salacetis]|nr:hypothetical protein [Bacillus salacetis]